MKVNPTQMTWQAPTQNVDGTPVDDAYGVVGAG